VVGVIDKKVWSVYYVGFAREKLLQNVPRINLGEKKSKSISEEIFQRQALGKDRLSF
jgi:hypothetical protein